MNITKKNLFSVDPPCSGRILTASVLNANWYHDAVARTIYSLLHEKATPTLRTRANGQKICKLTLLVWFAIVCGKIPGLIDWYLSLIVSLASTTAINQFAFNRYIFILIIHTGSSVGYKDIRTKIFIYKI